MAGPNLRGAALGLALTTVVALRPVAAEARRGVVVVGGVGAIHLEKRTPLALSTTSAVARLEAGVRLGEHTAARGRLEGFRADGLNLFAALVVDVDLGRHLGLSAFSGLSFGSRSGAGNNVGAGGFARWPVAPALALRADAYVSAALRNDFGGVGLGVVAGAEWRR